MTREIDRRKLLGAAAGAATAATVVAPQGAIAAPRRDAAWLRDAIELEQGMALAFATSVREPFAIRRPLERDLLAFEAHSRDRAETLTASLRVRGGHAPPPLARGPRAGLRELLALEEKAVAFYVHALGELHDVHLLLFIGSALAGHAQEVVVLREALRRQPLPRAFETGRPSGPVG